MSGRYDRPMPKLWRLSRYIRWAGTVSAVIVLIFVVTVIYSAIVFGSQASSNIQVGSNNNTSSHGGGGQIEQVAPGQYEGVLDVNITNPSWYPIAFNISMNALAVNGPRLAWGSSGLVTIPSGNTAPVDVYLHVPSNTFTDVRLLTNNTPVTGWLWINGTYATIFSMALAFQVNSTWGAPFQGLAIVPQTPAPPSGGSVTEPIAVNFTNDASTPDQGQLEIQVFPSGGGGECGSPTIVPISVNNGQSYMETEDVTIPETCNVNGGYVVSTYTSGGLTVTLPQESIP